MPQKYSQHDIEQAKDLIRAGKKVENAYLRRLASGELRGKSRKAARGHAEHESRARAGKPPVQAKRYNAIDIVKFKQKIEQGKGKDLSKYQRSLAAKIKPQRIVQLAGRLNIDPRTMKRIVDNARLDETKIYALRGQIIGVSQNGVRKILLKIQTENGTRYQFTTEYGVAKIIDASRDDDDYPELVHAIVSYA